MRANLLFSRIKKGKLFLDIQKLLQLVHDIVEKSNQGRQVILRLGGDKILTTFRANFEPSLSKETVEKLSVILGSLLASDHSILDQVSIQSANSTTTSNSFSVSSTTCFTPADLVANHSLPQVALKSQLKSNSTYERIYSPVTRTYFNKKVTFNDIRFVSYLSNNYS